MSRGKKYKEGQALIDREKNYLPEEAFELLQKAAYANFNETVEVHFNLGIDPRHADQMIRGTIMLPNGIGKESTVIVITDGENESIAKKAGADEVGSDELIQKIQGGWLDFDVLIATPNMMPKLGKLGKLLGARGLMPSPKKGTVTTNIESAVKEFKAGKLEYKNDKDGIVHIIIGKKEFKKEQLLTNFEAIYTQLQKDKPNKAKGTYFKSISISTTMGPGIKIESMQTRWSEGN